MAAEGAWMATSTVSRSRPRIDDRGPDRDPVRQGRLNGSRRPPRSDPWSGPPARSGYGAARMRAPRLAVPRWWPVATAGLGWSSVTIVIGFWIADGGPAGLRTLAGAATGIGRLTGLLSADLLLLQVLTMARVPLLERTYGQDGLTRIHRRFGFQSLILLLAHIVLLSVGYAWTAGEGVVDQFADFVADYPGVLLATASTALLILVAVTSIRRARKRLRYESWHLLHLYAYLGVGLSVPHELSTGADFAGSRVATLYWWAVYLAAVGAVLIWRIWLPLYRSLRHRLVVQQVVREAPGVVSIYLRGRKLDQLNAGAGQFFLWRFLSGRGWTRAHPYSLSAAPTPDRLRITIKDLGDDGDRLANLRPGTRVLVEGPFGRMHAGVRTRRKVTLFAAGIGVTPMRALLEDLDFAPGNATLIYRATDERELVFEHEIEQLARYRGARVYYLLGPRRRSRRGGSWLPQVPRPVGEVESLVRLVPDITEHDVYLCGPTPWLDAVVRVLRRAGVPSGQIHLERFSW